MMLMPSLSLSSGSGGRGSEEENQLLCIVRASRMHRLFEEWLHSAP